MNHDNIRTLRDAIASGTQPAPLNLDVGLHAMIDANGRVAPLCGDLAGQARLFADPVIIAPSDLDVDVGDMFAVPRLSQAQHWLDLDGFQASELFLNMPPFCTPNDVVAVLDRLLNTGEVQWT